MQTNKPRKNFYIQWQCRHTVYTCSPSQKVLRVLAPARNDSNLNFFSFAFLIENYSVIITRNTIRTRKAVFSYTCEVFLHLFCTRRDTSCCGMTKFLPNNKPIKMNRLGSTGKIDVNEAINTKVGIIRSSLKVIVTDGQLREIFTPEEILQLMLHQRQ